MSKDAQTPLPLTAAHVSRVLAQIDSIVAPSPRDLNIQVLRATTKLPGVSSTYIVQMDTQRDVYHQAWLGLEGELREGEEATLTGSLWAGSSTYTSPQIEGLAHQISTELPSPTAALPSNGSSANAALPTQSETTSEYTHRCMIPLHEKKPLHWMVVLQSDIPNHFSQWDVDLLHLLGMQLRRIYQTGSTLLNLQDSLSYHHQRLSLFPPSLLTALHMSRSFLSESNPIVATMQHNIDALRTYQQRISSAMDYYLDEIKLYASEEAIQRITSFDQRNDIPDIQADMDLVLQDTSSGLFQLRYYLNLLTELRQTKPNQEQFQLAALIQPVMSMLFNSKHIQFQLESCHSAPLYGNRSRLQQAFLVLFLSVLQHVDALASTPQIHMETGEEGDEIYFCIHYPTASEIKLSSASNEEEYLFVKQVFEEHQGSLNIATQDNEVTLTLYLPIMFEENNFLEQTDNGTPHSFEQVGPLELPAIESTDSLHNLSTSNFNSVIILSSDMIYARSMRRALQRQFDVFLAPSIHEAMDLLSAHPDFAMVLCDLEASVEDTFEILDEIQSRDPSLAQYVCFLLGDSPTPSTLDFARRLTTRCCDRHGSVETIQRFINRHRRLSC